MKSASSESRLCHLIQFHLCISFQPSQDRVSFRFLRILSHGAAAKTIFRGGRWKLDQRLLRRGAISFRLRSLSLTSLVRNSLHHHNSLHHLFGPDFRRR
ncbi:hypothetical protein Bca101_054994 [Brassica carinata]